MSGKDTNLDNLTNDQIRVLNCEIKTSFIDGWDRKQTFDIICNKIILFFESYLDYPEQLSIVLGEQRDLNELKNRLGQWWEDHYRLQKIDFCLFRNFRNEYVYRKLEDGKNKTKVRHLLLAKRRKIVFFVGVEDFFIPNIKELEVVKTLCSDKTIAFFWDYAKGRRWNPESGRFNDYQAFSRDEIVFEIEEGKRKLEQIITSVPVQDIFTSEEKSLEIDVNLFTDFENNLFEILLTGDSFKIFEFSLNAGKEIIKEKNWEKYYQFVTLVNRCLERLKETEKIEEKRWIINSEISYWRINVPQISVPVFEEQPKPKEEKKIRKFTVFDAVKWFAKDSAELQELKKIVLTNSLLLGKSIPWDKNLKAGIISNTVNYLTKYLLGGDKDGVFPLVDRWIDSFHNRKYFANKCKEWFAADVRVLSDDLVVDFLKISEKTSEIRDALSLNNIGEIKNLVNRNLSWINKQPGGVRIGLGLTDNAFRNTQIEKLGYGNLMTEDTIWDLQVSISEEPNMVAMYQLICYWLLIRIQDKYERTDRSKSIKKLAIFNSRNNLVHYCEIETLPADAVNFILRNVMGYTDSL